MNFRLIRKRLTRFLLIELSDKLELVALVAFEDPGRLHSVFVTGPISATFMAICAALMVAQLGFWLRGRLREQKVAASQPFFAEDNPFPVGTVEDA